MVIKKLLITIFISASLLIQISCKKEKVSLLEVIKQRSEERNKEGAFESNILITDFFTLENENYLRLYFFPGCIIEDLYGYALLDSFIILYFGVEDELAEKHLDLIKDNFEYMPCDSFISMGTDVDIKCSEMNYYKINNNSSFERIYPDDIFLRKMVELFRQKGYLSNPPPPPSIFFK